MLTEDLVHVAYYITGHGYGHATRSIELIRGLLQSGRYCVTIVSSLTPEFFLAELLPQISVAEHLKVRFLTLDTGGIQIDAIHMDPVRTLDTYYNRIHLLHDKLVGEEAQWMLDNKVTLALVDATPIASAAAKRIGIPSIYVTNITWDFVYETNLRSIEDSPVLSELATQSSSLGIIENYRVMVQQCHEDVRMGSAFIQHLGQCPLPSNIPSQQIYVAPLICRSLDSSNGQRRDLRLEYKLPSDSKLVLLGFGGHDTHWRLKDEFLPSNWYCFVLRATAEEMPSSRFFPLPIETYVPEYIASVDAVIGKMGYGTVSECLTAGRVLCYIPRVHWPEEEALASLLDKYQAGISLSLSDFHAGRWGDVLEESYRRKSSWTIDTSDWAMPGDATASMVSLVNSVLAEVLSRSA